MTDWEEWLRRAKARPSDHEDSKRQRTENQIKAALRSYDALKNRSYSVYVKGSYANNTNVRLNYDVDIAVEYNGFFYFDLAFDLAGHDKAEANIVKSHDPYTKEQFKHDIQTALFKAYDKSTVQEGNIAYRVRSTALTLPADVVPCWEYRRYDRITAGQPIFATGSRVFPAGGGFRDNFPKIQQKKGTAKNVRTNKRYKWMVRALKRLQTRLVREGLLEKELPSYLIECIVYNVPDKEFGHATYYAEMRAVLAFLFNSTFTDGGSEQWVEVHELRYLFRGTEMWDPWQVHLLADAAWDRLGYRN